MAIQRCALPLVTMAALAIVLSVAVTGAVAQNPCVDAAPPGFLHNYSSDMCMPTKHCYDKFAQCVNHSASSLQNNVPVMRHALNFTDAACPLIDFCLSTAVDCLTHAALTFDPSIDYWCVPPTGAGDLPGLRQELHATPFYSFSPLEAMCKKSLCYWRGEHQRPPPCAPEIAREDMVCACASPPHLRLNTSIFLNGSWMFVHMNHTERSLLQYEFYQGLRALFTVPPCIYGIEIQPGSGLLVLNVSLNPSAPDTFHLLGQLGESPNWNTFSQWVNVFYNLKVPQNPPPFPLTFHHATNIPPPPPPPSPSPSGGTPPPSTSGSPPPSQPGTPPPSGGTPPPSTSGSPPPSQPGTPPPSGGTPPPSTPSAPPPSGGTPPSTSGTPPPSQPPTSNDPCGPHANLYTAYTMDMFPPPSTSGSPPPSQPGTPPPSGGTPPPSTSGSPPPSQPGTPPPSGGTPPPSTPGAPPPSGGTPPPSTSGTPPASNGPCGQPAKKCYDEFAFCVGSPESINNTLPPMNIMDHALTATQDHCVSVDHCLVRAVTCLNKASMHYNTTTDVHCPAAGGNLSALRAELSKPPPMAGHSGSFMENTCKFSRCHWMNQTHGRCPTHDVNNSEYVCACASRADTRFRTSLFVNGTWEFLIMNKTTRSMAQRRFYSDLRAMFQDPVCVEGCDVFPQNGTLRLNISINHREPSNLHYLNDMVNGPQHWLHSANAFFRDTTSSPIDMPPPRIHVYYVTHKPPPQPLSSNSPPPGAVPAGPPPTTTTVQSPPPTAVTVQSPPPTAATGQSPPPTSACNCNGNGYPYYSGALQNKCRCMCNWPYGGPSCLDCISPDFVNVNGACVRCVSYAPYKYFYSLSGSSVNVAVNEHITGCSNPFVFHAREYWGGNGWSTASNFSNGEATLTLPDCSTGPRYFYLNYRSPGSTYARSIGMTTCVPPYKFTKAADVPKTVRMHFVDKNAESIIGMAFIHGMWAAGATSNFAGAAVSFYDSATISYFAPSNTTFHQLQAFVESRLTGAKPQCGSAAFGDVAEPFQEMNVIFGDLRNCSSVQKQSFNVALNKLAKPLWIGRDVSARGVVYGISFPVTPYKLDVADWFGSFDQFLTLHRARICVDEAGFFPAKSASYQRGKIYIDGICDAIDKCCVGSRCSSLVDNSGTYSSCRTPLNPSGNHKVSVVTKSGTIDATGLIKLVPAAMTYYSYFWSYVYNGVTRYYFYIYRANGYYSDSTIVNNKRCCRLVALSFNLDVMGPLSSELCFESSWYSWYGTGGNGFVNFLLDNLFPKPVRHAALQCYRPLVEDLAVDGTTDAAPTTKSNTVPTSYTVTGLSGSNNLKGKIEKYVKTALNKAKSTSKGSAYKHVRQSLFSAQLKPSQASDERGCGGDEIPEESGKCHYAWSAKAAGAGPYLVSAGFKEVSTTMSFANAEVGDIAVWPSLSFGGKDYPSGYIAIFYSKTEANGFVSDWVHDAYPIDGLQAAGASVTLNGGAQPKLYRLTEDAQDTFLTEEVFVPMSNVLSRIKQDVWTWCNEFKIADKAELPYWQDSVDTIQKNYKCPAMVDFSRTASSIVPRQLRRFWTRESLSDFGASNCLHMTPWSNRKYGVRCCYDASGVYMPAFPSQIYVGTGWSDRWQQALNQDAESMCCWSQTSANAPACKVFQERRPVPLSTNAPFVAPSLYTPVRRWGGAFGDPHCETYDGLKYECNFHGEARYTGCNDWKVHTVAEPVESGRATVITKIAVRYKNDTLVGYIVPKPTAVEPTLPGAPAEVTSASKVRAFKVFLNDEEVTSDAAGTYLTAEIVNTTLRVTDADSNVVVAQFFPKLVALATMPSDTCKGKTTGLTGNFNGDTSDDLVVYNTQVVVQPNATQEQIYDQFVLSQLVTTIDESLFDEKIFVAGNLTYIPDFAPADITTGCPASCKGDAACCFDFKVGGAEYQDAYLVTKDEISKQNKKAIDLSYNWPPSFTEAPTSITVNDTHPAKTLTFTAVDSNTIASLDCSICANAGVTCTKSGVATTSASLVLTSSTLHSKKANTNFTCTAVDTNGAKTFTYTLVVYIDVSTNAPTNAPYSPVGAPLNNQQASSSSDNNSQTGVTIGIAAACAVVLVAVLVVVIVIKSKKPSVEPEAPKYASDADA